MIADQLLRDAVVREACALGLTIASYASYLNEPPTQELNSRLISAGARVVLPVLGHRGQEFEDLGWARLDGDLADGARGIPVPTGDVLGRGAQGLLGLECAVIIMPALAVGRDGTRLGQGGGSYDRLLAAVPRAAEGGPTRIALVGPHEIFDTVPSTPQDQPIDRALSI